MERKMDLLAPSVVSNTSTIVGSQHTPKHPQHPLDPLSVQEMAEAISFLKRNRQLDVHYQFIIIQLHEPPKHVVQRFNPGDSIERQVFCVLLNNATGKTYEAVVSLTQQRVLMYENVENVQPALTPLDYLRCEAIVKQDKAFRQAMAKRGITNMDQVMVDLWTAGFGYKGEEVDDDVSVRICKPLIFFRADPSKNGYARPINGVTPVVDLNKMRVVRVDDMELKPIPQTCDRIFPEESECRMDLKPLFITQPMGPSFQVNGHHVTWQKWSFRVGFNAREGLTLHEISFFDKGRYRPIIFRASVAEMVVPYGDPHPPSYRKNAFDAGEEGLGFNANSLVNGCDCLGLMHYFDAVINDNIGGVRVIKNAICMHEEDHGILFKHTDWRTGRSDVRRSRRLVVSFFVTVANYDYGFYWYFALDGTIEFEVKMTGILNTHALSAHEKSSPFGVTLGPGLYAPVHQHFFCVRMEMSVDGPNNCIEEVNTYPVKVDDPINTQLNGYMPVPTILKTEKEGIRKLSSQTGRHWNIINSNSKNCNGNYVSYKLRPLENTSPLMNENCSIMKRAGFIKNHLWVTPFHPKERYPAGDYPNQCKGGEGLEKWTEQNRSIVDTDLVVWYNIGSLHVPRSEEWPIMPAMPLRFMFEPNGFFDRNPALDLPPQHAIQPMPPQTTHTLGNGTNIATNSRSSMSTGPVATKTSIKCADCGEVACVCTTCKVCGKGSSSCVCAPRSMHQHKQTAITTNDKQCCMKSKL